MKKNSRRSRGDMARLKRKRLRWLSFALLLLLLCAMGMLLREAMTAAGGEEAQDEGALWNIAAEG